MAVTIYDIAREANVGIGTVSRVLNSSPSVTTQTRERVLKVARRLNYHPHAYAQGLARKRTNTFAAIIPFFTNYFFIEVLRGVQEQISALGFDLILQGVDQPDDAEESLLKCVNTGKTDGILYFSMKLPPKVIKQLKVYSKPVILVDTYHSDFDSISVENIEAAKQATLFLIGLGHRKIGMINGNLKSVPAVQRLDGFTHVLKEHNIEIPESYISISKLTKLDGFSKEGGYQGMNEILERSKEIPTALLVASDIQAIGAMAALRERGLSVPQDVAMISFDDIELASHFGLTTMRQPMTEMGELAVQRLQRRIENPGLPPSHMNFVPHLIRRESSGSPIEPGNTINHSLLSINSF